MMRLKPRFTTSLAVLAAMALLAAPAVAERRDDGGGVPLTNGTPPNSGGASVAGGGLAPLHHVSQKLPPLPRKSDKGTWITGVTVTEYWPAPEAWFRGRLVTAPGLPGRHRIDWLYSATGMSMEGDGYGLDGRQYHIDSLGNGGWVTAAGRSTDPSRGWSGGAPYWRAGGYWRNRAGAVTFPLFTGGWSDGTGTRYVPLRDVTFAEGPSLPLSFYQSIAVDPHLIPLGSRVYVPAYRGDGHSGWFVAQDTGGAIDGRHIDVYRNPPTDSSDSGQYLTGERIFVIRPHK
jgi:3D (Asp-Asp-Asp) domain-containing protein